MWPAVYPIASLDSDSNLGVGSTERRWPRSSRSTPLRPAARRSARSPRPFGKLRRCSCAARAPRLSGRAARRPPFCRPRPADSRSRRVAARRTRPRVALEARPSQSYAGLSRAAALETSRAKAERAPQGRTPFSSQEMKTARRRTLARLSTPVYLGFLESLLIVIADPSAHPSTILFLFLFFTQNGSTIMGTRE